MIFLQTRQLCGVLGGDPKTAICWQWKCDTFAILVYRKKMSKLSIFAMQWYENDIELMMQSFNFISEEVCKPFFQPLTMNMTKS